MSRHRSPLRYPGGKHALASFVGDILNSNGIDDGVYVEPYCGGAAVALDMVSRELVRTALINDADYRIFAFWNSILNDTEGFLRLLRETKISLSEWRKQRAKHLHYEQHDMLYVGFATFYLNRCNRSGILSAGPIGGYEQDGQWKLDARFNKVELARRIEFIARYPNRIKPSNLDALTLLRQLEAGPSGPMLVYLDPPYYAMGDRLYLNYYGHGDHVALSTFLKSTKLKWILSYDDVPEIRKLYPRNAKGMSTVGYSAHERRIGNELLVFSDSLNCKPTLKSHSIPSSRAESRRLEVSKRHRKDIACCGDD